LMDLLKKALYQDLLCGLAWFNIGIEFNKKNQYQDACIAFTMCGLVQTWDIEAWINATICSFNRCKENQSINEVNHSPTLNESMLIFALIINTAYFFNKEKYLEALYENLRKQQGNESVNLFNGLVDNILFKNEIKEGKNIQIRLLNDDGKFVNLLDNNNDKIREFLSKK
ncbi:MAG: hypothetical protein ABII93_04875, partial [Chrysiogenia bacterium]